MPHSSMKTVLGMLVLGILVATPSVCFALMSIDLVTKERAKELGLAIRATAAGPEAVRIHLDFETKGDLAKFSRVGLDVQEGGKLLVSSTLKEDRAQEGRVAVSFAADRANLDRISVTVVVEHGLRSRTGYVLKMKDFVDLKSIR